MKSALILAVAMATATLAGEKKVNVEDSKITWKGEKVTGHHEGTIKLQEGTITFDKENNLTGGTFVMDMTSINVTDLEGGMKGKLEGHLKSDDFFGTEKHKTAKFVITKVDGKGGSYKVTGNMTIKGITNPVSFDMKVKENTAIAHLKINRTKYDIKYGSASFFDGIKDKAIYDEFELNVNLVF
ncbi:MAG TPA: YceI family protein [Aquaticitalea sp.]|nr:YceI family protein [Aquaticitalea sp.]HNU60014.1 YceI family protein [Aquaticitalea sp.]